jgi:hypothetical protein
MYDSRSYFPGVLPFGEDERDCIRIIDECRKRERQEATVMVLRFYAYLCIVMMGVYRIGMVGK